MNFSILKDVEPETAQADAGSGTPAPGAEAEELNEALSEEETEFVAAEKKPINQSALMLLAILVLGGAGMYVMRLKSGPQAAKAADPAAVNAEAVIANFMKGGNGNISLLRGLLEQTAKIVEQFRTYPNIAQVPLSDLKANPFHFATAKPPPEEDPVELARKKKEEVLKAVQALRLQSVVIRAGRKACMINNTMYQEGDTIDNFTLEKINPNAVVVKSGAYRFELRMAK